MRTRNLKRFNQHPVNILILLILTFNYSIFAQTTNTRKFSGSILTQQFELVPNVAIEVQTSDGKLTTTSDAEGNFNINVPNEPLSAEC